MGFLPAQVFPPAEQNARVDATSLRLENEVSKAAVDPLWKSFPALMVCEGVCRVVFLRGVYGSTNRPGNGRTANLHLAHRACRRIPSGDTCHRPHRAL